MTAPLFPLLLKMSVPTILGMLMTVVYNLTDTFFVGLLDNRAMIASLGVVFSFMSMIQALGFWFGYGSGSGMSIKLGEGDEDEALAISMTGLVLAMIVGVILVLVSRVFLFSLTVLIGGGASYEVFEYSFHYLSVSILGIPFILVAITLYNQLRLCGNVRMGACGLLVGMIGNILLDPVFMFFFGMGFIGAGYASLLSHVIACLVLIIFARQVGIFRLQGIKRKKVKKRILHILAGGLPNFSRQAITSVSLVLLNVVASTYGETVIAGLTVSARILALPQMLMVGWSQGFQPICAMNFGAGQIERVEAAFRKTVLVASIFLFLTSFFLFLFSQEIAGILTSDRIVLEKSTLILRIQCVALPFLGYYAVSSMYLQNVGKYVPAVLISISRQGSFFVPLLFLLGYLFGEFGLYLLQAVSDVLSFLFSVFVLKKSLKKESGKGR